MPALKRTVAEDRLNRRVVKQCIETAMHLTAGGLVELFVPMLGVAGQICLILVEPSRE